MAFQVQDEDETGKQGVDPNAVNQVPSGQGGAGTALIQATSAGAGSQAGPGGVTPSGGPSASPQPSSSGQYTNLQKYLQVNQDQAQPLADKVTQPIAAQAQNAQSEADAAKQNFDQQAASAQAQVTPGLLSSLAPSTWSAPNTSNSSSAPSLVKDTASTASTPILSAPAPLKPTTDQLSQSSRQVSQYNLQPVNTADQQVAQRADQLTANQQAALQQALKGQYSGPTSMEQTGLLGDALSQAQQAQTNAKLSATEPGRFTLLQQMVGKPGYQQGQQLLDQAILETNPQAVATLQNLQNQFGGVTDYVNNVGLSADAELPQFQQQAAALGTQTKSALQNALAGYQTNLAQKSAYENTAANQQYGDLQSLIQNYGSLSPQEKAQVSSVMTGVQGTVNPLFDPAHYSMDLAQYLGKPTASDASSVATANDASEIAALQNMLGQQSGGLNASEIGTFDPKVAYDSSALQKALINQAQQFNSNSTETLQDWAKQASSLGSPGQSNMQDLQSILNLTDPTYAKAISGSYAGALGKDNQLRTDLGLAGISPRVGWTENADPAANAALGKSVLQDELNALQQEGSDQSLGYLNPTIINSFFQPYTPGMNPTPGLNHGPEVRPPAPSASPASGIPVTGAPLGLGPQVRPPTSPDGVPVVNPPVVNPPAPPPQAPRVVSPPPIDQAPINPVIGRLRLPQLRA